MFGLLNKLKIYVIMFSCFAVFAGIAYWYYKDSQAALAVAAENQARLEQALRTEQNTIESLKRDILQLSNSIAKLNKDFASSRELVRELELKFSQDGQGNKRDFGELARKKPKLVEQAVNQGTQEVFRCLEILSGANIEESENEQEYINCLSDSTNSDRM